MHYPAESQLYPALLAAVVEARYSKVLLPALPAASKKRWEALIRKGKYLA
jgi:hypothetical protein